MKVVHIKANVSFMDVRRGDESVSPLDATVQGWINAGFVTVLEELPGELVDSPTKHYKEVLHIGEGQAGPGSAEPDDEGGVEDEG